MTPLGDILSLNRRNDQIREEIWECRRNKGYRGRRRRRRRGSKKEEGRIKKRGEELGEGQWAMAGVSGGANRFFEVFEEAGGVADFFGGNKGAVF